MPNNRMTDRQVGIDQSRRPACDGQVFTVHQSPATSHQIPVAGMVAGN